MSSTDTLTATRIVRISIGKGGIEGELAVPKAATGIVIFAHGSGSSRHSSRNQYVATALRSVGLATLLIDLLTLEEEQADLHTREFRFDIGMLADRMAFATDWVMNDLEIGALPIGYFGASTGAAAALVAAARWPGVSAVVSRGGRPDLADDYLPKVRAATLLIVGGEDHEVIELNRIAHARLARATKRELHIVPGATHLFEEAGALEDVVSLASAWFLRYLTGATMPTEGEILVW
jgi:pimeloyl-ACP methyl ester carboxylesterase